MTDIHPSVAEKLEFFAHNHLPEPLFSIARQLHSTAHEMANQIESSPQLALGLQKLMEAKDCFVRAKVAELNKANGMPAGSPIQPDSK